MPNTELQDARLAALGRRIRETRHQAGLSQAQLAEKCGLAKSYIAAVERGERNVSNNALWSLADALMVTPAWFYTGWR